MNTPYEVIAQAILNNAGAKRVLAALESAGYAVVQLPEERENGTYDSVRVHGKGIKVFGEWIDADCARGVAADLLRAADQLEALSAELLEEADGNTLEVLYAPVNAERLRRSLEATKRGDYTEHNLIDTEDGAS